MVNDVQVTLLGKVLDAAALRHKVIANNLANANTPGYQRRVVSFGDHLAEALRSGDVRRLEAAGAQVVKSGDAPRRPDGNNVSAERELADLMKNSLIYNACTRVLSTRLAAYRAAISGDSRTS